MDSMSITSKHMRILFRHLAPGQEGSVSSLVKMIEAYCERFPGDDLTVMCAAGSPLVKLERLKNCHVAVVGRKVPREAHLLGAGDVAVWRLNRAHHFDVFWAVNVGLYVRGNIPQVLTVNNSYQVYPPDTASLHPASKLRVSLLRRFFHRSLRLSSAVMVQTPLMKTYIQQIPGCPEQVVVLPKAVVAENDELERALPRRIAERFRTNGEAKLLFVAANLPHKNYKVLAGMMQQFRRQGSSIRLVITITANDWKELAGAAAMSLVESGHVIPLGWVDKDDLGALYRWCDVCVILSLLESLSSAHIEAMYWKKPQVVADLPYAHDLCGDSALYAATYDASAWCSQVKCLLADASLREKLVTSGAQRVAAFPRSWTVMAEGIRPVLAEAAAGRTLFKTSAAIRSR
jgi:glycosyltransferase involved in cell wall biosynthesis